MKATELARVLLVAVTASLPAWPAAAQEQAAPATTLDALDQRLRVLERQRENDEEAARARALEATQAVASRDGYALRSANGDHVIRFRALLQHDTRTGFSDLAKYTDSFLVRRARPYVEGTIDKWVDFRLVPDFGGGAAAIQDAYLELKFSDALRLRGGRSKTPFSQERLFSVSDLWFVELGLPAALAPNYDTGITLRGEPRKGAVDYAVAVVDGAADGASVDGDTNDAKDVAARLYVYPTGRRTGDYMPEAGLGLAVTWGRQGGASLTATGLPSYKTAGQQTFFSYRTHLTSLDSATVATGKRFRLSPQARFARGRTAFQGEYVISKQDVRRLGTTATLDHRAWQAAATWVLTGESAGFRAVRPRKPFDPVKHQWGAWELAARFNQLQIDTGAFQTFADRAKSAQRARGWALGLNGYLTDHAKFVVNYEQTRFAGGAGTASAPQDRRPEKVLLTRIQVSY